MRRRQQAPSPPPYATTACPHSSSELGATVRRRTRRGARTSTRASTSGRSRRCWSAWLRCMLSQPMSWCSTHRWRATCPSSRAYPWPSAHACWICCCTLRASPASSRRTAFGPSTCSTAKDLLVLARRVATAGSGGDGTRTDEALAASVRLHEVNGKQVALPWAVYRGACGPVFAHSGQHPSGYTAVLAVSPRCRSARVVLANAATASLRNTLYAQTVKSVAAGANP